MVMVKPKSIWLLGTGFLAHVASRLTLTYDRGGIQRFREQFDREGLIPLTERDRELHASWTRCTACGLCDLVCPDLLSPIAAGRFTGPRQLASGSLRHLADLKIARGSAEKLAACEGCGECESICPVEIPLRELAEFVARIGSEADDAN
jgi:Fe-S oxidoreductase